MKLYFSPGACSLSVHIALREVGLPFELVAVRLPEHTLADGRSYYDISPRGYVPLLELDDGSRHTEASALLQFVADQDPQQRLIGAVGSARRLAVTEWLAFVSTELHKTISPWLWIKDTADSTRTAVRTRLDRHFKELDQRLASQDYLAVEFSIADAYAFTVINWANFLSIPLADYPSLQAYQTRVSSRPAVQAALKAEGLLK